MLYVSCVVTSNGFKDFTRGQLHETNTMKNNEMSSSKQNIRKSNGQQNPPGARPKLVKLLEIRRGKITAREIKKGEHIGSGQAMLSSHARVICFQP